MPPPRFDGLLLQRRPLFIWCRRPPVVAARCRAWQRGGGQLTIATSSGRPQGGLTQRPSFEWEARDLARSRPQQRRGENYKHQSIKEKIRQESALVLRADGEIASAAFEMQASELAAHAWKMVERGDGVAGLKDDTTSWEALAFQVAGFSEELSLQDAYSLLRAFGMRGFLGHHAVACQKLVARILHYGEGRLKPHQVVSLWTALDRADATIDERLKAFFEKELQRALPGDEAAAAADTVDSSPGKSHREAETPDRVWRRLHVLLEASGCSEEELLSQWSACEAALLADGVMVRALSIEGLIAALRVTAKVEARLGRRPEPVIVQRLCDRVASHARWLDSWAASHVVLSTAALGAPPGRVYDQLRDTVLARCALTPPSSAPSSTVGAEASSSPRSGGSSKDIVEALATALPGLAEAERVAASLALLEVHDAEVRNQLKGWLFKALPLQRLAPMALDLAKAGLRDSTDPELARLLRSRARSSAVAAVIGQPMADALLHAYEPAA